MQIHKLVVSVLDFDELGADGVKQVLEDARFPNRCINPDVVSVETRDIGEWSDDNPLNKTGTASAEFERLFAPVAPPVPAPQAAGAVSIDSPAFHRLMGMLNRAAGIDRIEQIGREIIAFADAHAAQHGQEQYEVGFCEGQEKTDVMRQKWNSERKRADTAEASLARLVEGVDGLERSTFPKMGEYRGTTKYIEEADLLALLPAKAEAQHDGDYKPAIPYDVITHVRCRKDCDCSQREIRLCVASTPAPAMGEELPPTEVEHAAYRKWMEARPHAPAVTFVEAYAAGYRACMALRQPGAEKTARLRLDTVPFERGEQAYKSGEAREAVPYNGHEIRVEWWAGYDYAANLVGTLDSKPVFVGDELCGTDGTKFLAQHYHAADLHRCAWPDSSAATAPVSQPDTNPDNLSKLCDVFGIKVREGLTPMDAIACYVKDLKDALARAPVSQPAAQEQRPVHQWHTVGCSDWYDGHPDHEDGGGPYETRTLYTAPQPLSAPAGSEQELSADVVYALADEHGNGRTAATGAYLFKPLALVKFASAIQAAALAAQQEQSK